VPSRCPQALRQELPPGAAEVDAVGNEVTNELGRQRVRGPWTSGSFSAACSWFSDSTVASFWTRA
jgi:hypothetical protein